MPKKSSNLQQVLIGIVLAAGIGLLSTPDSTLFGIAYIKLFGFLGQLFLNALTLLAVPLVSSSVIFGVSQMGRDSSFPRLGAKTLSFYIITTFLAVMTGLLFIKLIQPGFHVVGPASSSAEAIVQRLTQEPQSPITVLGQMLTKVIPVNIFEAASQGNMLGIIFFSLLFGFALSKIESEASTAVSNILKGLFYALMRMTHFLMRAMPFGVFFLVTKAMASQSPGSFAALLSFFGTVLVGLVVFMFFILPLFLRFMGLSPFRHLRAMAPALIAAFSTSSSAAALPITMDCVEKRAGVSNRICSFVVPLGTSVNMAGSALYECMSIFFIAQVYGIELSIMHQAMIVFLSLITSMGIAGIPSGSLVAILIVLKTLGFPAEGLALILPFDRILDMCRTTTNVFSDATCAVLVAHSEGEKVLEVR
jgi:Na+/H+-dicarboxylate symporter